MQQGTARPQMSPNSGTVDQRIRIVTFGASGATGQHVIRLGDGAGHNMVAVTRTAPPLTDRLGGAAVIPRFSDAAAVRQALTGADAVVVALGIRRRSRSPVAPLVSAPDTCTAALRVIVPAMVSANVKRLVYISAHGVGESWAMIPWWAKPFITATNARFSYADHSGAEAIIRKSGLDWTILRPTILTDEPGFPARPMNPDDSGLLKVSRIELARFALAEAARPAGGGRCISLICSRT